jgi:predicted phosphoadenosine phosphosulfate sulfurtransferase
MTLEDTVRELVTKKEIEDLITWRFARAIDWINVDAAKACFHLDARFVYDAVDMNAQDFCAAFAKSAGNLKMRSHFIGCAAVALHGTRASGETYAIYAATYADKDTQKLKDYVVGCRYLSELEQRDSVWRISRMQILFDWSIGQDSPEKTASGNTYSRGLDVNNPLHREFDTHARSTV